MERPSEGQGARRVTRGQLYLTLGVVVAILVTSFVASVVARGTSRQATFASGAPTSPSSAPSDPVLVLTPEAPAPHSGAPAGDVTTGDITGPRQMCLDDANAQAVNGNAVDVFPCNGTRAQVWTVTRSAGGDVIGILGLCLGLSAGDTFEDAPVAVYRCDGSSLQRFVPRPDGALYNPRSGRCLADPDASGSPRTIVLIRVCNGSAGQRWSLPT